MHGMVGVVVDQRRVQLAVRQALHQVGRLGLDQLHARTRRLLSGGEGTRQDVRTRRRERADPQGRDTMPSQGSYFCLGGRDALQHRLRVPEQDQAEVGELRAARRALDQVRAERRLQRVQVMSNGGLAVAQRPSRSRKGALVRHRPEDDELPQVEHRPTLAELHIPYGAQADSSRVLLGSRVSDTAGMDHACAPYAEALETYAERGRVRLDVPGHQADVAAQPALAALLGRRVLELDVPPLTDGVDYGDHPTPLGRAAALAADAWGAKRTWFLTNGASKGNLVTCLALRGFGRRVVVQRSVHSSVVDGLALAGLDATFVQPSLDAHLGIAHGVTPAEVDQALHRTPDAVAAYIVTPSYFGAVADVAALAEVAHAHGVPLVVDEAWGAHFGFHPELPVNALRLGADLVISSTHKLAGSLTQSAMLHLGHGAFAERLEPLVDRGFRSMQSTSASALLMASLDLARRELMLHGRDRIGASLEAAVKLRAHIQMGDRFRLADQAIRASSDVVALDPLRVVVDTRSGGVSGHDARHTVFHEHGVHLEMSTDAVVVAVIGAGAVPQVDRFVDALHALPRRDTSVTKALELPPSGAPAMSVRAATFAPTEVVPASAAVGRVSADSLAAYPPGIPNLLPGEVVTAEAVDFLQQAAAAPYGHVRGALRRDVSQLRVVTR